MKNNKNSKFKTFRNNLYALKTIWQISKRRIIHATLSEFAVHATTIFFSTFFIRYLILAIEAKADFHRIMMYIGLCFVIFASLAAYNSYFNSVIIAYTDNKIHRTLYKKIYAKARNVELRCFEDPDFYNRYTMALDGATERILKAAATFISIVLGTIAAAVAFYSISIIDRYAIIFAAAPIIGNFAFGGIINRLYAKRYEESVKNNRKMDYVNRVMYLSDFAKELRYSNIFTVIMDRYKKAVENNRSVIDKYGRRTTVVMWLKNSLVFMVPFEGIMLYAAYRAMISKTMGLAELAVIFSAMVAASWILINLFNKILEGFQNGLFLTYFRTFMEYQEKIAEDGLGTKPNEKVESIEFRNVSFEYKEGSPIIKNLSFKIDGDKTCAFVGHNGAGKTTIIKLLFRLYDPTEGEILVNGTNIKQYHLKAYRKLFAAALQDYKIMSMSIKENILMGMKVENADEIVENALKQADILDRINELPQRLDTQLTKEFDKDGVVFSGGQVQKIIVARAFAQPASVKVFDEPTSALDPIAEYHLYNNIMKQSKEQITLFISHRLSSVKAADMVFMLEDGMIIESGAHAELMKNNGPYCEMFMKQAKNYLADEEYREELI